MSSRYAFSVYDTNGLKRDLTSDNFAVLKAGVLDATITIINNNDGTYYFTVLETNKYSIKINGISQDEMTDIFIVTDDIITQDLIDDDTLEFDGGILQVKTGVFSSADHNHDDDYSAEDHTHVTEGPDLDFFFDANNNDALSLSERSALSDDILSLDVSLAQNISNLSSAVINLQTSLNADGTGAINYRQIGSYINYANGAPGDTKNDNTIASVWTETSLSYVQKYAVPFVKRPGDATVLVTFSAQIDAGGTPPGGFVQVRTGANAQLVESLEVTATDKTQFQISIDISAESNEAHEVQIFIKSNDVTKTFDCELIAVEIA